MDHLLPEHGRVRCQACFPDAAAEWGCSAVTKDGWLLENNPMAWGSRNPEILVLGVSKGPRQCDKIATMPHDAVPFAGFRGLLTDALRILGLLRRDEIVDEHISAGETRWAFGSILRCSVGLERHDSIEKSGTVVSRLAQEGTPAADWMRTCMKQYLRKLPPNLRIVVMLSNDDGYADAVFSRLREIHPELRRINDVAYTDGNVTWVHVVHVGGPGRNHIKNWMSSASGKQAAKRDMAVEAVANAIGRTVPRDLPPAPVRILTAAATASPTSRPAARPTGRKPREQARELPNNSFRPVVVEVLDSHPMLRRHPKNPEGSQYVKPYLASNGHVLAHEPWPATLQPIWVSADGFPVAVVADIPCKHYPAGKSRNSNLRPYQELWEGACYRFEPKTADQVKRIVDALIAG